MDENPQMVRLESEGVSLHSSVPLVLGKTLSIKYVWGLGRKRRQTEGTQSPWSLLRATVTPESGLYAIWTFDER